MHTAEIANGTQKRMAKQPKSKTTTAAKAGPAKSKVAAPSKATAKKPAAKAVVPKPRPTTRKQQADLPSETNPYQPHSTVMEDKIVQAYKELLLGTDTEPTVHSICQKAEVTEADFHKHFATAADVGKKIWRKLAEAVTATLASSQTYAQYGAREKLLAYFYTFYEQAVAERSFIAKTWPESGIAGLLSHESLFESYRDAFKMYAAEVVADGVASDEVKERLSLSSRYPDLLWVLHQRLMHFWLADTSEQFTATERAIEVYSKVPLELMGHNILDSMLDALKFSFESFKPERFFRL